MVATPSAIADAGTIFSDTDLDTLKAYLTFHFLSDRASWLGDDFDQANFAFFSQTLNGVEEQRERAKRGVDLIGGALGNVLDRVLYGAVADFLNMSCCGIENPYAFNVADIAIFAGAFGLVLFPGSGSGKGSPKRKKGT